jgi:ABC-2 type transport system permease protein
LFGRNPIHAGKSKKALHPTLYLEIFPTKSMPSGVRAFAENQPMTSIVEAIRALLSGQPVGNDIWVALAWCVGIIIVAYIFAMRAYKKRA